jgi:hypothetical protein
MMLHRLVRTIAAACAAVLVATLAPQANAYASSTTRSMNLPVVNDTTLLISAFPPPPDNTFHVGDCVLSDASVTLFQPGEFGSTQLWFDYTVTTNKTSNFDQWHATFKFKTVGGFVIFSVGPIDLNRMKTGQVFSDLVIRNVSLSQAVFNGIASVDWVGEC